MIGTGLARLALPLLLVLAPRALLGAEALDPGDLIQLGAGDSVTIHVYGQSDMDGTVYVSDAGEINLPLAGAVHVAGLAPTDAARQIEKTLTERQILVDPHVTVTLAASRAQRVAVLGEVHTPGRYPVDSRTSLIDLLAEAGGTTENSADVIYVLRPQASGGVERIAVRMKGVSDVDNAMESQPLKGGDRIFVPRADVFYVEGEVKQSGMYRLEPGMTVLQAIARGGGITDRGSRRRIVIERTVSGRLTTVHAGPGDRVQPNDVIRVKESLF